MYTTEVHPPPLIPHASSSSFPYLSSKLCHIACSRIILLRIRILASYSLIRASASSILPSTIPDI